MLDPEVVRTIDELDKWAETQPIVRSSLSLADLVRTMNQAIHAIKP